MKPKYKRILLKLSGEALMGEGAYGISRPTIDAIVAEIAAVGRQSRDRKSTRLNSSH